MKTVLMLNQINLPQFKAEPIQELCTVITQHGYHVIYPNSKEDLLKLVEQNPRIGAVLFDWDDFGLELCGEVHHLNEKLPLVALTNRHVDMDVSLSELRLNLNFFEYYIGQANDIFIKLQQIILAYTAEILPPFTKALFKWVQESKYTFCTPGHLGGSAFLKSPVGSLFYDFYGSNTFKADVSVSMPELGSLLDHSGPHKEAEDYIAHVFNATASYIVTNGTSTANKIVGMFAAPAGSTVLVDRNCHKSITHLLMMSDVVPLYFRPTRNAYGMLGGIPKQEFTRDSITQKLAALPQVTPWPGYAVITNSTYDGLLYNIDWIKATLDVPHMHFDGAWIPYTCFHPIYQGKYGMSGAPIAHKVVYETQSTHKLLAAFSQASMIHIKGVVDPRAFNEVFMMHTSTSPQYGIVASTEIAAAMMQGNTGQRLISNAIEQAWHFRKEIKALCAESTDWFFDVWQPDEAQTVDCWPLCPNEQWHGFDAIDADHMYLDPIKVTLLMPGSHRTGKGAQTGIPAAIVAKYLDEQGIVVEKTGPYSLLFLFSIGIDKSKSLKLLHALTLFKRAFDKNAPVSNVLPSLYQHHSHFYKEMGIQELAQGIHELMNRYRLPDLMCHALDVLPQQAMTPYQAFQCGLNHETEEVYLEQLLGRVSANMVLPYPPGVPLVLPGEVITEHSIAVLDFLLMLVEISKHYPGFDTDIHGAYKQDDGRYRVKVIRHIPTLI